MTPKLPWATSPFSLTVVLAAIECLALSVGTASSAGAQTTTLTPPAPDISAAERAERDGDKVFKWILIHSDKPRKGGSGKDDKPAAVATTKPAAAAKPAKADEPARSAPAPLAAPVVASTQNGAPAPASMAPPAKSGATPKGDTQVAQNAASAQSGKASLETGASFAAPSPIATAPMKAPAEEPVAMPAREAPAAAAADTVYEVLTPVKRVDPKIPPTLMGTIRGGHVEVRFTVQPDGSVTDTAVNNTSNRRLIPYALAAVAQWKFKPLKQAQEGAVDLVFDLE